MIPHPVYDRALLGGGNLGDLVLKPLDAAGVSPLVVDVGARNGFHILPRQYVQRTRLVGFEPNEVEYKKLLAGATDAERHMLAHGVDVVHCKSQTFHPYALWDHAERRTFYVTRGAGACTLMGATTPLARNIHYRHAVGDPRRQKSLFEAQTEVVTTVEMECRRLDDLLDPGETVDFLKIDVEGAELRVLQGAEVLLARKSVLFIRSEFQLVPYYEEHPLLCDQHRYLADRGFRLLHLDLAHPRYRRGKTDLPDASDHGLLLAGDALYSLDPDKVALSPMQRSRIAALAFAFDLAGYGLSLAEEANLLQPAELAALTEALRQPRPRSVQGRILDAWQAFPYKVRDALSFLRAR